MNAVGRTQQASATQTVVSGETTSPAPPEVLEINVVFTGLQATLKAVQAARRLSRKIGARVRILVPQVVPFRIPLDAPLVPASFVADKLRAAIGADTTETRIEVWLCRDSRQVLQGVLVPCSVVVMSGPLRWWPSAERRLACWLEAAGHQVIFSH
jgi:hypothetical protein